MVDRPDAHDKENQFHSTPASALGEEAISIRKESAGANLISESVKTAKEVSSDLANFAAKARQITLPENCGEILGQGTRPNTMDQLKTASKDELACLWHEAPAGEIPKGHTDLISLYVRGYSFPEGGSFWNGKIFGEAVNGETPLTNIILGHEVLPARAYTGNSWIDGKPSTIIDYSPVPSRDEVRKVGDGLYLAFGEAKVLNKPVINTIFALEPAKDKH